MKAMSLQSQLAEFVATAPARWGMSESAVVLGNALVDTFTVAIAGSAQPLARRVVEVVEKNSRVEAGAPAWLSTYRCTFENAALVSGTLAHALDYDDVTPAWRGHPSGVLLPALTSLACRNGATLDDVLQAYVIGFEVGARIGERVAGAHYERGWHATSTIGSLATTAAGCRLLHFDTTQTCDALGLAVAQAAGVQANFGTDAKVLQAGFAAAAAVRACLLAEAGIKASAHSLDGPTGFADLYGSQPFVFSASARDIATGPCAIARHGIEFKIYPNCYAAHRAVDAALAIRREVCLDPDDIEAIEIEGTRGAHAPLRKGLPANGQQARFSVEFAVACALLDAGVGLRSFDDAMLARGDIRALMARTTTRELEGPSMPRSATVRVRCTGGRVLEQRTAGLSAGSVAARDAKVVDCLSSVGAEDCARALIELLERGVQRPVIDVLADPLIGAIGRRVANAGR
jgi:2-methylcitrate dehydratase PrpD